LSVTTLAAAADSRFREEFSDLNVAAYSEKVAASAGKLVLANTLGVYETEGVAYLGPIAPSPLLDWQTLRIAANVPSDTSHYVQFFTEEEGSLVLIPDGDLSGNSIGLTDN